MKVVANRIVFLLSIRRVLVSNLVQNRLSLLRVSVDFFCFFRKMQCQYLISGYDRPLDIHFKLIL
jgi:hypothetical protein